MYARTHLRITRDTLRTPPGPNRSEATRATTSSLRCSLCSGTWRRWTPSCRWRRCVCRHPSRCSCNGRCPFPRAWLAFRVRVTGLKYGALELVNQIFRHLGGACAPSRQPPAPQGPGRAPEQQGSRKRKKRFPRHPGWVSATFVRIMFWATGPPRAGTRGIRGVLGHFGLGRLLGHLGGACASSQQQASSKQQLAPQDPGRPPEQ